MCCRSLWRAESGVWPKTLPLPGVNDHGEWIKSHKHSHTHTHTNRAVVSHLLYEDGWHTQTHMQCSWFTFSNSCRKVRQHPRGPVRFHMAIRLDVSGIICEHNLHSDEVRDNLAFLQIRVQLQSTASSRQIDNLWIYAEEKLIFFGLKLSRNTKTFHRCYPDLW